MARKGQHTISKRQRERKKAEKAAQKRARRAATRDSPTSQAETTEDPAPAGEDAATASE
jgi:hypothetical protein